MNGDYLTNEEAETGPVKIYMDNGQLYIQEPNQLPVELYPSSSDTVFHHYFNGEDLTITFNRNFWGQATGAQTTFSFNAYNISEHKYLTRTGVLSYTSTLVISIIGVVLLLILTAGFIWVVRKRRKLDPGQAGQL